MVARMPEDDAAIPDDDGSVADLPFSESDVADGADPETDFSTPADFESAEFDPSTSGNAPSEPMLSRSSTQSAAPGRSAARRSTPRSAVSRSSAPIGAAARALARKEAAPPEHHERPHLTLVKPDQTPQQPQVARSLAAERLAAHTGGSLEQGEGGLSTVHFPSPAETGLSTHEPYTISRALTEEATPAARRRRARWTLRPCTSTSWTDSSATC
jgi:hypothetical protein